MIVSYHGTFEKLKVPISNTSNAHKFNKYYVIYTVRPLNFDFFKNPFLICIWVATGIFTDPKFVSYSNLLHFIPLFVQNYPPLNCHHVLDPSSIDCMYFTNCAYSRSTDYEYHPASGHALPFWRNLMFMFNTSCCFAQNPRPPPQCQYVPSNSHHYELYF